MRNDNRAIQLTTIHNLLSQIESLYLELPLDKTIIFLTAMNQLDKEHWHHEAHKNFFMNASDEAIQELENTLHSYLRDDQLFYDDLERFKALYNKGLLCHKLLEK
jgi:hypothetical protein